MIRRHAPNALAAALCSIGLLSIGTADAGGRPDLVNASLAAGREYVPNELLVQFRPGATNEDKDRALARVGAGRDQMVAAAQRRSDGKGDLELVSFPPGLAIAAAMRDLSVDLAVEFAEPNWVFHHMATSNDTYAANGSLWGMTGTYGSGASVAWAAGTTDCSSVYVGIIDEGYMYTHEDLVANVGRNPGEIAGNG
jgi:hypothetical protein